MPTLCPGLHAETTHSQKQTSHSNAKNVKIVQTQSVIIEIIALRRNPGIQTKGRECDPSWELKAPVAESRIQKKRLLSPLVDKCISQISLYPRNPQYYYDYDSRTPNNNMFLHTPFHVRKTRQLRLYPCICVKHCIRQYLSYSNQM